MYQASGTRINCRHNAKSQAGIQRVAKARNHGDGSGRWLDEKHATPAILAAAVAAVVLVLRNPHVDSGGTENRVSLTSFLA